MIHEIYQCFDNLSGTVFLTKPSKDGQTINPKVGFLESSNWWCSPCEDPPTSLALETPYVWCRVSAYVLSVCVPSRPIISWRPTWYSILAGRSLSFAGHMCSHVCSCACSKGHISMFLCFLPSGKLSHSYWKSPFFMGKLTISMAIFNSYFDITRGYPHFFLGQSPHILSPFPGVPRSAESHVLARCFWVDWSAHASPSQWREGIVGMATLW